MKIIIPQGALPPACQECPLWRWIELLTRRMTAEQIMSALEEYELIIEQKSAAMASFPGMEGGRHDS